MRVFTLLRSWYSAHPSDLDMHLSDERFDGQAEQNQDPIGSGWHD
jgi:hypothetical protein